MSDHTAEQEVREGWNWLQGSPKWHYFVNGESLCGRWFLPGWKAADGYPGGSVSSDDCAMCRKKLAKRKEVGTR